MANRLILPRFVPWSSVNTLSNSFAARATILIPLIGYLVLFNEKIDGYLNLIGALNGADSHYGVSLRLLSLYMGLCFVAAAVMVYSLRCPRDIKGFSTAPDFIGGVQNTISGPSLRIIEVAVASDPTLADEFEALRSVRRASEANDPQYVRGLLFLRFGQLDRSREYSRFFCILLYAMGFAFISIPSGLVFIKIFGIFYHVMRDGISHLLQ